MISKLSWLLFSLLVICGAVQGSLRKYTVSVKTGKRWGAGTDARVWIKLFGTKGETAYMELDCAKALGPNKNTNCFERKQNPDKFEVQGKDIGIPARFYLKRDDGGKGADWYVDWIQVDDFPRVDVLQDVEKPNQVYLRTFCKRPDNGKFESWYSDELTQAKNAITAFADADKTAGMRRVTGRFSVN